MCYAIVKVQYHNDKEPSALLEVDLFESLQLKLEEVKNRPGVKKVTVFRPYLNHELVSEWKINFYDKENLP